MAEGGRGRVTADLARTSASSLPGRREWPGTHWSRTEMLREDREEIEDQTLKREAVRRKEGGLSNAERQDWESLRTRTDWKVHEEA